MSSLAEIGPKARSLLRMREQGLPVPEARFLGADAFREHLSRAGSPDAIRETPVADEVVDTLYAWYLELGSRPLAVRSSALSEDLPDASFAGQHGTYFVSDPAELADRVRDCWASLYSERALSYRSRNSIAEEDVAMAVIVQQLVPAMAAGVAFSLDPLTGEERVVVEACLGIGETLVSGRETPDRFVFARPALGLVDSVAGEKRVEVAVGVDGSVAERAVPEGLTGELSVSALVAREIAEFAIAAEQMLGVPADIEWAWDGMRVWLTQARPVTVVQARSSAGALETTDAAQAKAVDEHAGGPADDTIWSNVNTGEILPDVITPMTWSIIYGHAEEIFGGMFGAFGIKVDAQALIGLVGGRVYFNLSVIRESFRHLPGVDLDRVLGGLHENVDVPPVSDLPRGRMNLLGPLKAILSMPAYIYKHTARKADAFALRLREMTELTLAEVPRARDAREEWAILDRLVTRFSEFNDSLAFMAVAMVGFGFLIGVCEKWLGDTHGALANRLVAGRGDVASALAGHELWRLSQRAAEHAPVRDAIAGGVTWADTREALAASAEGVEFLRAWDAFMAEYGHHRRGELEFGNPTWAERPDYVLETVRGYLAAGAGFDPIAAYQARAVDSEAAAQESMRRLRNPFKRAVFRRVLTWGRASARSRENVKSEAVRWLAAIRAAMLATGGFLVAEGALAERDDVFYVSYPELEALTSGRSDAVSREEIAARRAEHDRLSLLTPPPVVIGVWDERDTWAAEVAARYGSGEGPCAGVELKGLTVSAGVVRGPARVLQAVESHEAVLPGEILVAPFTDPGWTPYFIPAAGIVMNMGGLLSHGSIIAREYGIPAVVNVGPATQLIETGQIVEVDGERGVVRVVG